ncbi:hypothetical protein B9Z55_026786 [Caenorhabditis nigoni]|uniref:F-box domain-containing protein n=1 Tax=Caenorhabditis nigoni TaxID=1611254 RepID=A0A2G5SHS7_9PELO|nr:hypothetical protein B9Z55_026786 [Caenorhabditis nigoni]
MGNIPESMKAMDRYSESIALGDAPKKQVFDMMEIGDDWRKKTIMDMPVSLMLKIAGNLDPVERTALRSVNRALKDLADDFPPIFENIELALDNNDDLSWRLNDRPRKYSGYEKLDKLTDLPGFKVKHLRLRCDNYRSTWNRNYPLEISLSPKSVDISANTTKEVIQLLSIAKPGDLESIRIWPVDDQHNFSSIFNTEQFQLAKNVEVISLKGFHRQILSHFSHLKSFKVKITGDFVEEGFEQIRDIISNFEEFETCQMGIVDLSNQFDIRNISKALEVDIPFGPLKTIIVHHRYEIPKTKKCLDFKIEQNEHRISVKIAKIC